MSNTAAEEWSDLHADLILYDGYIAGMIFQVIGGTQKPRQSYDRARDIAKRIQTMLQRYPEHSRLLQAYQQEYNDLQAMLDIAERMAREQ